MKKQLLIIVTILGFVSGLNAQVGVNSTGAAPHPSAMLDVSSTTKGLLIPRMSTTDKNNISPKPAGLFLYDNSINRFQLWNGISWMGGEWTTVGNDIVTFNPGNVGIGNGSPQNKLQIGSTISPFAGNDLAIGNSLGGGMSLYQSGGTPNGASIWYSNSNFALMPVGGGAGSVGINFTNPSARLDIFQTGKTQTGFGSYVSPMRLGIGVTGSHAVVGDNYDAVGVAGFGANAGLGKKNIGILGTTSDASNSGSENIGVMAYQNGSFSGYLYGIYNEVTQNGGGFTFGSVNNVTQTTSSPSLTIGVSSNVFVTQSNASNSVSARGGNFSAECYSGSTSSNSTGVSGSAQGVGRNIGVFGYANNGITNYAIYGDGNGVIKDKLLVGAPEITATALGKLTVQAPTDNYGIYHTDGVMALGTYISSLRASLGTKSNHDLGFFTNNVGSQMILKTNGRVGIGTVAPIAYLHINGFGGTSTGQGNFFYPSVGLTSGASFGANLSIYASDGIASSTYVGAALSIIASDNRIKNIISLSNNSEDLERLKKIQITNYRMKDVVTWGTQTFKKVIAQQVEQIYPEVIKLQTSVIPDIYALAESVNYDAQNKKLNISLSKDYGIKIGEKIELVHPEKGKIQAEVVEVSGKSFTVKNWEYATDKIFVFGREVNDFRSVDYEALSMLGISAIQQLAKEIEDLKKTNSELNKVNEKNETRFQALESALKTLLPSGK
jgi:Chaperone of endosialidase